MKFTLGRVVALAASVAALALPATAAAADPPFEIETGPGLSWGLKESWRSYIGAEGTTYADGAGANPDGTYHFPIRGGSYDASTQETVVRFGGTVHFTKHDGALDLTLSDPRVEIRGEGATLYADMVSRSLEGTGELVSYEDVRFADLDIGDVEPETDGGVTRWNGIRATLAPPAVPAFAGFYQAGTLLDRVTFAYDGPGGKQPPASESWSDPATPSLRFDGDLLVDHTGMGLAEGPDGTVIVAGYGAEPSPVTPGRTHTAYRFTVLDAQTGAVRQTVRLPYAGVQGGLEWTVAVTSFIASAADGTIVAKVGRIPGDAFGQPGSALGGLLVLRPDADGSYPTPAVEDLLPVADVRSALSSYALAYDETTGKVFMTAGSRVLTFAPGEGGYEQVGATTLPGPAPAAAGGADLLLDQTAGALYWRDRGAGQNMLYRFNVRSRYVATPSLTGSRSLAIGGYANGIAPLALDQQTGVLYAGLSDVEGRTAVAALDARSATTPVSLGSPVGIALADAPGLLVADGGLAYTLDPAGKTIRLIGRSADGAPQQLGEPLAIDDSASPQSLATGGDGTLFVSALGSGGLLRGKRYLPASSPSISGQPQDATLLLDHEDDSAAVTFTVAGAGDPAPAVQWQTRAPGTERWTDLADETSATLTAQATPDDDQRAYRAVLSNAAGRLATRAATVTVRTPPSVLAQPTDVSVLAGEDAVFSVMPTGTPYPEIQWQQRIGGFWRNVDEATDGFLQIEETNVEMSGAQFRARLVNPRGTVYSRVVTLTVAAAPEAVVTFGSGHLDWGVAERWRCYVVGNVARGGIEPSGGAEQLPGTLAQGALCNGRNAGSEALRFPIRGGRYDASTGRLELTLGGAVRFWGHDYHVPGDPTPQLDTRFSNLRFVAEGDSGTLYADVVGATMENPLPVTRLNLPLVSVDLSGRAAAPGEGQLSWSGLTTALTAQGAEAFGSYPAGEPFDPIAIEARIGTPQPDPEPQPDPDPAPQPQPDPAPQPDPGPRPPAETGIPQPARPRAAGAIAASRGVQTVDRKRRVRVATISCPAGAPCRVAVRRRVAVRIAGRRHLLRVLAPATVKAGGRAAVRVRLTRRAAARLAGRSARLAVKLTVTRSGRRTTRTVTVTVRGKAPRRSGARR